MRRLALAFLAALTLAAAPGCGSTPASPGTTSTTTGHGGAASSSGHATGGGSAHGGGGTGGFAPAAHAPFPQLPDQGGPKLDKVHVITIDFAGKKFDKEVDAFGSWLVTSDWYLAAGKDYGVGAGTHEHVSLAEAPPATISAATDPVSFLQDHVTKGSIPAPPAGSQYLYVLYLPPETMVTDIIGGCDVPGTSTPSAFHETGTLSGVDISYAMVPICATTQLAWTEVASAHEIIEAATNPLPLTTPAFAFPATSPWYFLAEVADLCEALGPVMDSGFWLPRYWSNSAAKTGTGWPCLPALAQPYFGVTTTNQVVKVAAGKSTDVTLDGWSTGPVPTWNLLAQPVASDPAHPTVMPAVSLSGSQLDNGQQVKLTISVPAGAPSKSESIIAIRSDAADKSAFTFWTLLVEVP